MQATYEGLTRKKVWNSIDRRKLSIALSEVSLNFTVRLNETKLIQCQSDPT